MNIRALIAGLGLLVAASAFAAEPTDGAAGTAASDYRLQAGDVLAVAVWREPDLTQDVLIRPDGAISFPLAGQLPAANRSPEEVREDLETRIRRYVPEAVVTVSVRALAGNRIYVIGKVARPGDIPLLRPTDVLQALALAGGPTAFADVNDIKILRRENGLQTVLTFRYGDVERGKRLEQNVQLRAGDTLIVP